jgi:hypothetical protein
VSQETKGGVILYQQLHWGEIVFGQFWQIAIAICSNFPKAIVHLSIHSEEKNNMEMNRCSLVLLGLHL